jgi:hypothetical protein
MKKSAPVLLLAACSLWLLAFSAPSRPVRQGKPSVVIHITTAVSPDGSGTFAMEIVLGKDVLGLLRSFPDFGEQNVCDEFASGIEGFPEMTETEGDGSLICSASKPFADLEGLAAITEQAFDAGTFERLEITGGRFYYDLAANVDTSLAWDTGMPFGIEAWWIVKAPGEVVETNAENVSGRTLSWNLLTMNSASHLRVESKVGGAAETDPALLAAGAVALLGCCCVLVLIAGGAAFFLLRRKPQPSASAG